MRKNRKYLALLFLCIAMPICFFMSILFFSIMISFYIYIVNGYFHFYSEDIYSALKAASVGIPIGIGIWYLECRRLGVKIFGK